MRHRDGRLLYTECLFTDLLTHDAVGGIVVNLRDITERKQFEEQLTYQAFHDPVTALANRALFRDRVAHALSRRGDPSRCLAVLFVDLDDFKTINDTFGHDAGDQVLQIISTRLRSALRESDTAARLGGDEFAVLLEDVPDETGVSEIVAELLPLISAPLWLDGRETSVDCSIGIAAVRSAGDAGLSTTVEELLRNADVAMYQAKAAGGNTSRHFKPEMHETVVAQLALRADLKAAIEANELTLAYQPMFDVETILQLPIDVLKIDEKFIDSVDGNDRESRLTAAIIGLAGVLDLGCVAEGVERPAQHERLKELGCHSAQGFLLAGPMTYDALRELLRTNMRTLVEVG